MLFMMDLIESWVGTIWIGAVTLTFVKEALHEGEAWWGYINGGYYLGAIVGGLIVLRLSRRMQGKLTMSMLLGASLFGVLTLLYRFVSNSAGAAARPVDGAGLSDPRSGARVDDSK
ncbi:hypothetical protein ACFCP7_19480 [Paenibacillus elgii]